MSVMVYVAVDPTDGTTVGICVDEPKYKKQTAKDVAGWIRGGYSIRHMPLEEGREFFVKNFK